MQSILLALPYLNDEAVRKALLVWAFAKHPYNITKVD